MFTLIVKIADLGDRLRCTFKVEMLPEDSADPGVKIADRLGCLGCGVHTGLEFQMVKTPDSYQWCGGSEAAGGGSPINGTLPPASHTFLPLGLGACHGVGTTCNDHWTFHLVGTGVGTTCNDRCHCAINLGGWGGYKPRSSSMVKSWWRSRGLATWKLQRICILWSLNPVLLLPNNTWMVMHSFMYIAVKSHRKIPKVQNFQFSSFFIRTKKCVCSIVPAGQYFSNLKAKQFKSHRSVPRSTLHVSTYE